MYNKSSLTERIAKPALLLIIPVIIILLIIPLPAPVLDTLIAVNLLFALTILIIVLGTRKTQVFSLLPILLLIATLFGMAVFVAVARLILIRGAEYDGRLVRFVSLLFPGSGNIVGLYMGFAISIVIIAFFSIVITKGAVRVAEVAARFTLDSLPVKLMAIEAEYDSGAINEEESALRKTAVQKESDFFEALDGSVKFISGNVKVNIIIICVIVFGGLLIAILHSGISFNSFNEVNVTYIPLAVGSGILFMLPPFLLSIAVGCLVTREIKI